ncbi:MAG: E3 binding domain-containing protein, partial [Alphaproteobacteria bacterium]|nr:E3 binding domain-containing protein [Alphaproteobacteria bacterium]
MTIAILMPALSPTMTEGTLAKWLVKAGDTIKSGMVIAEIETDKATMEVEAVDEGVMLEILIPAGSAGVLVNTAIATISGDDESAPKAPVAPAPVIATAPIVSAPVQNSSANRVFISPLARRIALDKNLDISKIQGTGPHGRIIRDDVEGLQAASAPAQNSAQANAPAPTAQQVQQAAPKPANNSSNNPFEPEFEFVPLTTMRKVIANRLSESKQTIPHFYLSVDV